MQRFKFGLMLALLLGAAAWPLAAQAQTRTRITLGYTPVIDELSAFVAIQEGYFAKGGLEVTLQQMPNGNSIPPGMLSNSLQIGAITAPTLIQSKAAGFPMNVLAGASYVNKENLNGWIVVCSGVTVAKPADLVGKRVAVGAIGSYFDVLFRKWLADNNVVPDKVIAVEAQFPSMADLLRGGQIDAATLGQPYFDRAVASGVAKEFVPYTGTFGDRLLSNIYTATDDWLAANPKAATAFRDAIAEADRLVAASPEKARAYAAAFLKLPPDVMAGLPFANYGTDVQPQQIGFWSDTMLGLKLIDTPVDPASVLYK